MWLNNATPRYFPKSSGDRKKGMGLWDSPSGIKKTCYRMRCGINQNKTYIILSALHQNKSLLCCNWYHQGNWTDSQKNRRKIFTNHISDKELVTRTWKKKWSKGKVWNKLSKLLLFEQVTYDKLCKKVPSYKLITPPAVSEDPWFLVQCN